MWECENLKMKQCVNEVSELRISLKAPPQLQFHIAAFVALYLF